MLVELDIRGLYPEDVDYLDIDMRFAFVQHKREFIKIFRALDEKRYKPQQMLGLMRRASRNLDFKATNLKQAAYNLYNKDLFKYEVIPKKGDGGAGHNVNHAVVRIWISDFYLEMIDSFRSNLGFGAKHLFRGMGRSRSEWLSAFEKGIKKDYNTNDYDVRDVSKQYKDKEAFFRS